MVHLDIVVAATNHAYLRNATADAASCRHNPEYRDGDAHDRLATL